MESNVGNLSIALSGGSFEATGINSVQESEFLLFPNPNEGLFYLESKGEQIQSYSIYNSLGKIVWEEKTNGVFERIDLSKQAKGLYFIAVETEDGVFVEKILVQ